MAPASLYTPGRGSEGLVDARWVPTDAHGPSLAITQLYSDEASPGLLPAPSQGSAQVCTCQASGQPVSELPGAKNRQSRRPSCLAVLRLDPEAAPASQLVAPSFEVASLGRVSVTWTRVCPVTPPSPGDLCKDTTSRQGHVLRTGVRMPTDPSWGTQFHS